MRTFTILLLLILLNPWTGAQGLDANFRRYNMDDGLPNNQVNCVVMDTKGFLWFGTNDGLSRFDGLEFKNYFQVGEDDQSISSATVLDIAEDKSGNLWLGTLSGGLDCFDPVKERFVHYDIDSLYGAIKRPQIKKIWIDEGGKIWLATYAKGLVLFNPKSERFQSFSLEETNGQTFRKERRNTVYDFIQDISQPNILWLAGDEGLYRFNRANYSIKKIHQDTLGLNSNQIIMNSLYMSILQVNENELWLGSKGGGLAHYFIKENTWERFLEDKVKFAQKSASRNDFRDITLKSEEELWVCDYRKGLAVFNLNTKSFQYFKHDLADPFSVAANQAERLFKTAGNLIWVSHPKQKGVSLLDPALNQFKEVILTGLSKNDLYQDNASSFQWDASTNQLYVSYWGGAHSLVFNKNKQLVKKITRLGYEQKESNFSHLLIDQNKTLWARTSIRLGKYNKVLGKFEDYAQEALKSLPYNGADLTEIFESSTGSLWTGTTGGGLIKIITRDSVRQFVDKEELKGIRPASTIVDIEEDKKGKLWIGTNTGLYQFDTLKEEVILLNSKKPFQELPDDIVYSLEFDKDGLLWIGYVASGIYMIDAENKIIVKNFNRSNGLSTNHIVGIQKDGSNRMWILSKRGLMCYLPDQGEFLFFNKEHGIINDELETGINFCPDGNIYFGVNGGFQYFNPDSLLKKATFPKTAITNLQVIEKNLPYSDQICLPYDSNFVSFQFSVLSYSLPENNKYAYRLQGFEDSWSYAFGQERKATYRRLPPGNYTFQLKGANYLRQWSEEITEIDLQILAPWWQRTWFYSLCFLLFLVLFYWIYKNRMDAIKRREKIRKRLAEYEIKALRAQMNPHFIFNSLNSIKLLIQDHQEEEAISYLSKFSKLIRKVLQYSEKQEISLSEELEMSRLYLEMEKLRFEDEFAYSIEVDPSIDASFMMVPPMIIQPYLENAIWHGLLHLESKGTLQLNVENRKGGIICIIEDNGIGREKAKVLRSKSAIAKKSMGMRLTANRLAQNKLLNGQEVQLKIIDRYNDNGKAIGTRVELLFLNTD